MATKSQAKFYVLSKTALTLFNDMTGGKIIPLYAEIFDKEFILYNETKHFKRIFMDQLKSTSTHKPVPTSSSSSNSKPAKDVLKIQSINKLTKLSTKKGTKLIELPMNSLINWIWLARTLLNTNVDWRKSEKFKKIKSTSPLKSIDILEYFSIEKNRTDESIPCTWEIISLMLIGSYFQTRFPKDPKQFSILVPYNWEFTIELERFERQSQEKEELYIDHEIDGEKYIEVSGSLIFNYLTLHLTQTLKSYSVIRDDFI